MINLVLYSDTPVWGYEHDFNDMELKVARTVLKRFPWKTRKIPARLYGNFRMGPPSPMSTSNTEDSSKCHWKWNGKHTWKGELRKKRLTIIVLNSIKKRAICIITRSINHFTNLDVTQWLRIKLNIKNEQPEMN